MQKENDTLLVAKLREGNKFAFEALYEKNTVPGCTTPSSFSYMTNH